MDFHKAVKRALKDARPASMSAKSLVSEVLGACSLDKDVGKDERKQAKKRTKKGVAAALSELITSGKVAINEAGEATWQAKKRTLEEAVDPPAKKKAKKAKKSKKSKKEKSEKKKEKKEKITTKEKAATATAGSAAHTEPKADEAATVSLANLNAAQGLVEGDEGWVKPTADQVTILLFYAYCKPQFSRYVISDDNSSITHPHFVFFR